MGLNAEVRPGIYSYWGPSASAFKNIDLNHKIRALLNQGMIED